MQSLELNPDQAAVLHAYVERAVEELTVEIAATDSREYRDRIKGELRLLKETLEQLTASERPGT